MLALAIAKTPPVWSIKNAFFIIIYFFYEYFVFILYCFYYVASYSIQCATIEKALFFNILDDLTVYYYELK